MGEVRVTIECGVSVLSEVCVHGAVRVTIEYRVSVVSEVCAYYSLLEVLHVVASSKFLQGDVKAVAKVVHKI